MTDARLRFVNDRIDEDEQAARAAVWDEDLSLHWTTHHRAQYDGRWVVIDQADEGVTEARPTAADDEAVAKHIARHDPARILAEVDAKRRILAIHRRYVDEPGQACLGCAGGIEWEACPIVLLLALPYVDHPDFREEWRP
jgi:hypothetical protein